MRPVRLAEQKIYDFNPQRYYILSNAGVLDQEKNQVIIEKVKQNHGCQIILNGLLPTIKYYLRLIVSLDDFVSIYLDMIENDTELQETHKLICNEFIEKYLK